MNGRLALALLLGTAIFGLAQAPAGLLASRAIDAVPGLAFRAAEGTIWSGSLRDLRWRMVDLGDAQLGLSAWSLLRFSPAAVITLGPNGGPLQGHVTAGSTRISADDLTARLPLAALLPEANLPQALLELRGTSFRLERGSCVHAQGPVVLHLAGLPAMTAAPVRLSGALACTDGELTARLTGSAAGQALALTTALPASGSPVLRLETVSANPAQRRLVWHHGATR